MIDNNWVTGDLPLAAALVAKGYKIRNINKDGFKAVFEFDRTSELIGTVSDYWDDNLLVSARKYADSTRALKSRIYND